MSARARIKVEGVVQGVGFRYYAYRKALELQLNGFVRNTSDGDVESEVEGARGLINEYLQALKRGSAFSHVTNVSIDWLPFENKFNSFNITY
jgi:acylphosphatase